MVAIVCVPQNRGVCCAQRMLAAPRARSIFRCLCEHGSGRLTMVTGSACAHFPLDASPSMKAAEVVMLCPPSGDALPNADRCRNRHAKVIDFFVLDKRDRAEID